MTDHIVDANKKVAPRCGDCRSFTREHESGGMCRNLMICSWGHSKNGFYVANDDHCKYFTPKDPAHDQR